MKVKKKVKTKRNNITNVFEHSVVDTSAVNMRKIATKFRDDLKFVIENQTFKWKPLNEEYKKQKIAKGWDERILIATADYIESIDIIKEVKGEDGVVYSVGVEDRDHEETGLNLILLARYLEYGTSKMPARPHWRTVWSMLLAEIPHNTRKLKKDILRAFKKRIR